MAVMSYKCPNCGGGLTFDPEKQKLMCEYCLSEFTEEDMRAMEAAEAVEEAAVYLCPSCGAQIVTDATTAATFCYYCHNPVVLSGRVSGENLPDYLIPFAIDKKQAKEMFATWIAKKKYVPDSFYSKDQIETMTGVYFPYFLYSCKVDGRVRAQAEKQRSWVTGNIRYTEHKQYRVEREGCLDVKNLTRNALSKGNRELVEGVLPFETEGMIPFQMGYLSGFQAEKRDMDYTEYVMETENEVKEYTIQNLTSSIEGYSSVQIQDSDTAIRDGKWQYAMLPVWVMTYKHKENEKLYYFAMNGQTGRICGKLPVDKGKLIRLFTKIFVPVFACLMVGGWFI